MEAEQGSCSLTHIDFIAHALEKIFGRTKRIANIIQTSLTQILTIQTLRH